MEVILSNIETNLGIEVIAVWQKKDAGNSYFFTDSNGLELIRR